MVHAESVLGSVEQVARAVSVGILSSGDVGVAVDRGDRDYACDVAVNVSEYVRSAGRVKRVDVALEYDVAGSVGIVEDAEDCRVFLVKNVVDGAALKGIEIFVVGNYRVVGAAGQILIADRMVEPVILPWL